MNTIRKLIKSSVKVPDDALYALAILSDLYGRSYYRFGRESSMLDLRKEVGAAEVNPFIDISTCQWWEKIKGGDQKYVDTQTADTLSKEGIGSQGGTKKDMLFMKATGGGIQRPLGFRVCNSVLNIAKARAWFLEMVETLKVGDRAKGYTMDGKYLDPGTRLPKMQIIQMTDKEFEDVKAEKRKELKGQDPAAVMHEIAKIERDVWYRLLECPNCSAEVPEGFDPKKEGLEHLCLKCNYTFHPVFQIMLDPLDIVTVFPYCAAMRFCADFSGANIPKDVLTRYTNTLDWLRDEVGTLYKQGNFKLLIQQTRDSFKEALKECNRKGASSASRKTSAGGKLMVSDLEKEGKKYPFYYQALDYMATACDEGFSKRWPGDEIISQKDAHGNFVQKFGKPGEEVQRLRHAWDDLPYVLAETKKKPKGSKKKTTP
jgi:hypothetical protein